MVVEDNMSKLRWTLMVVYGSAHEEHKEEFLIELSNFYSCCTMPYIVGGDFNILRHSGEKNKKLNVTKSVDMFNSVINTLGVRDVFISGGKYTWSNNQAHP